MIEIRSQSQDQEGYAHYPNPSYLKPDYTISFLEHYRVVLSKG
jgi:hypothetical protein